MGRTAKVSISLPDELLKSVEQTRINSHESRSDFFRRAAEALLRQDREQAAVERYVQGYKNYPEAGAEESWARVGEGRIAEGDW